MNCGLFVLANLIHIAYPLISIQMKWTCKSWHFLCSNMWKGYIILNSDLSHWKEKWRGVSDGIWDLGNLGHMVPKCPWTFNSTCIERLPCLVFTLKYVDLGQKILCIHYSHNLQNNLVNLETNKLKKWYNIIRIWNHSANYEIFLSNTILS